MTQLITHDIAWVDPALPEPARAPRQTFMRASCRAVPDLQFGEPDPPASVVTDDVVLWGWHMEGTNRGRFLTVCATVRTLGRCRPRRTARGPRGRAVVPR